MHDVGRRMRAGQKPREKLDQATEQWRCPICFWRRWRPGIAPREIISSEASAARDRLGSSRSESTFGGYVDVAPARSTIRRGGAHETGATRPVRPNPWIGSPDTWRGPEDEETDHELCPVDRSGAARGPLSVRRGNEAGPFARDAEQHVEPDAAAGPLPEIHRRGRGARRDRVDPPRPPARSADPDTAGRRRG